MRKIKKIKLIALSLVCSLGLLTVGTQSVLAYSTDTLYSKIDSKGNIVDGNKNAIQFDKPVIRPTYLGSDPKADYTGPEGYFKGFWDEKPGDKEYYGQEIIAGQPTIIRNVGFYKNQSLALRINHTTLSKLWTQKVTLQRDGGLAISPQKGGTEFQLVYNDGVFETPVEDVYVEIPIMSLPSVKNETYQTYSYTAIKTDNLKRYVFQEQGRNVMDNEVSRKQYEFREGQVGNKYNAEAIHIEHRFTRSSTGGANYKEIGNTVIFDNHTPLTFANNHVVSTSLSDILFKSDLKTPGEISYLPPRTNGVKNTDKLEVNFDLTQGLNDGFEQYFPEYMSVMMDDADRMFNSIDISTLKFTDQYGKDISKKIKVLTINPHLYEFQVSKADLIELGSNQLNIELSAGNLNNEQLLTTYNKEKNMYEVPVTFYNYKVYKGKRTESDKMRTVSEITPSVYGEAKDGITATQYTYAKDLDINSLLKNVATTIPSDVLKMEFVEPTTYFDQVKTYQVPVRISSTLTTTNKVINVPVSIIKATPVTSAYFEHQTWLINYLNKELAPKKIDKDMYMTDLLQVKTINDVFHNSIATEGEHIPRTIKALSNLEDFKWTGMNLTGSLPTELGELPKLRWLELGGNQLTGEIPNSLTNLSELRTLTLRKNQLTGTLPPKLNDLENLRELSVDSNKLIGQIPLFPANQLELYDVRYNQVTIDTNETVTAGSKQFQPEFTLIPSSDYTCLTGVRNIPVSVDDTLVKPFDAANEGFFDLHIEDATGGKREELYAGHTFVIKSLLTDEIVYEGPASKTASFKSKVGESFEVTMDGASNNPNNVVKVEGKLREIKLKSYPKTMTMTLKAGDKSMKPIELAKNESLEIFDNRVGSKWELKAKTSELVGTGKKVKGSFYYKAKKGTQKELSNSGYTTIESGNSEAVTEVIDVTKDWNDTTGLLYKQDTTTNYKGSYTGKVYWQLFDGPTGS